MKAAQSGHVESARILLQAGADKDKKSTVCERVTDACCLEYCCLMFILSQPAVIAAIYVLTSVSHSFGIRVSCAF
jgi:hypothetical protein